MHEPTSRPVNTAVTRRIDLDPVDWYFAAWRALPPLPRPEPLPFDRKGCLDRLARVATTNQRRDWDWGPAAIGPALGPEEGHFWLNAMSEARPRVRPREVASSLRDRSYGNLSRAEIRERCSGRLEFLPDQVVAALAALLPLDELLDFLLSLRHAEEAARAGPSALAHLQTCLRNGFARFVVPYLTAGERDRVRQRLAPEVALAPAPDDPPSLALRLAALLGMHAEVEAVVTRWPEGARAHYRLRQEVVFGLGDPKRVVFHARRLGRRLDTPLHVRAWLANAELAGLDLVKEGVRLAGAETADRLLEVLCLVKAPEAAVHVLELSLACAAPARARRWLEEEVGNAVAGLVPVAAGAGKRAEAAAEYLRGVRHEGFAGVIEEQLRLAPADVTGRVRRVVIDRLEQVYPPLGETPGWLRDALAAMPWARSFRPPDWLRFSSLPPLVVGEHRLGDGQVRGVLAALAQSTLGAPRPLVRALGRHADAAPLDAFAWRLFELWLAGGAPVKDRWGLTTLAHLGGDASATRLAPLVAAWPGQCETQRALAGLECLAAMGTDLALMQLNAIARRPDLGKLQPKARALVEEACRARGLTPEQLEDRTVPDLGLDAHGGRSLDFGPRQFRVALGADLEPVLRDELGNLRDDLPKPGARDDPTKAAAAVAAWKLFKEQLRQTVTLQAARLRRALVLGRRWPAAEFESVLVRHPVLGALARRLLWGCFGPDHRLVAAFRLTAEGDYADVRDAEYDLPSGADVGLVHPAQLAPGERKAWGERFADYEIFPPFAQLTRRAHALRAAEAGRRELSRYNDRSVSGVEADRLLREAGWVRGTGPVRPYRLYFPGGDVTAVVKLQGWEQGGAVRGAFFLAGAAARPAGATHALKLGAVDPGVLSEVIETLRTILLRK